MKNLFLNKVSFFFRRGFHFFLKLITGGDSIRLRRGYLSKKISSTFDNTVAYGPLKGMVLGQGVWSTTDRASMIFGLYEQEVLNAIIGASNKRNIFIDLGAADGYYAIGALVNQHYKKSYAFEMTAAGRAVIKTNAKLNHVSDRLKVYGKAEKDFYWHFSGSELSDSVVLVDIEGAEFEILNEECLAQLKNSVLVIEIHDWKVKDGAAKKNALILNAKKFFKVTELVMGSRDLSCFPELKDFNDTDRWLICSEGRERLMTWLKLDPL